MLLKNFKQRITLTPFFLILTLFFFFFIYSNNSVDNFIPKIFSTINSYLYTNFQLMFILPINIEYFQKTNYICTPNFNSTFLQNFNSYPLFFLGGLFFLFTSLTSLCFSPYLGLYGIFYLNFFSLFFFFISFLPYFNFLFLEDYFFYIKCGKWFTLNTQYKIDFDFFVDNISASFALLTISIAIFVYIYAFAYFRFEPLTDRLIMFLNLFIISMVFLVSSGNFINLFLGWELIGMTSFFLINFWSVKIGTFKSAFKAFSFNKFSDLFLFFAILLVFNITFSVDIITFLQQVHLFQFSSLNFFFFTINYLEITSCFFLLCAFIKSAQIGAHIWLPDSMEAPVPASALIHSATLVSAGIFLLLRFTPLFELSDYSYVIIAIVGATTSFYGGFSSMYQSDTKKILAYSTISHCGFLMVIYTTGVIEYVLLYLYIHGFFKAAVFMCIGNVNRLSKNNQDFKKMGLYYKFLPFDCYLTFIGLLNLSGIPFTLGFYIKHLLLIALNNNSFFYYLVLVNCILGALSGLFYSSRLFFSVFFDFKKSKKILYSYYSGTNLQSKLYSNSSKASNYAITLIFYLSYVMGLLLTISYATNLNNFSFFFSNINTNSPLIFFFSNFQNFFSFGYINYLVCIFIFFIIFTSWRYTIQKANTINFITSLLLFISIFLIILK